MCLCPLVSWFRWTRGFLCFLVSTNLTLSAVRMRTSVSRHLYRYHHVDDNNYMGLLWRDADVYEDFCFFPLVPIARRIPCAETYGNISSQCLCMIVASVGLLSMRHASYVICSALYLHALYSKCPGLLDSWPTTLHYNTFLFPERSVRDLIEKT